MNEQESRKLYDRVVANWNIKILPKAKTEAAATWHHYLKDLPYGPAAHVIDGRALAGGFPPRPAEIFTATYAAIGAAPPSAPQALVDSKNLSEAIRHGTPIPAVHPLVSRTLADVGVQRDDVFQKLYEERRTEFLADMLDNPPSYLDGGNKREDTQPNRP